MSHTPRTPFYIHTFPAQDGHERIVIGRREDDGCGSKEFQLSVSRAFHEIASHEALVAACRAACKWIAAEQYDGIGKQIRDALAAAAESAEPQAMSDPLDPLDGTIRGED